MEQTTETLEALQRNKYKVSPLPFRGQKRRFRACIFDILPNEFKQYAEYTWIDAYGGSGLLSRWIKDIFPNARVIYNDFDNFAERVKHIPQTNSLLAEIKNIATTIETKEATAKRQKLKQETKDKILRAIYERINKKEYVDYITLASRLLFNGKQEGNIQALERNYFYYNISANTIKEALDYFSDIEITHEDAISLIKKEKAKNKNCVLVLDPPYLATSADGYKWGASLGGYFELLDLLEPPYLFFASEKSDVEQAFKFFQKKNIASFIDYKKIAVVESLQQHKKHKNGLTDYMFYKV